MVVIVGTAPLLVPPAEGALPPPPHPVSAKLMLTAAVNKNCRAFMRISKTTVTYCDRIYVMACDGNIAFTVLL
jgi:hypothetical protein